MALKHLLRQPIPTKHRLLLAVVADAGPGAHAADKLADEYGMKIGEINRSATWLHHYGWQVHNSGDVVELSEKANRILARVDDEDDFLGADPEPEKVPDELLEKPKPPPQVVSPTPAKAKKTAAAGTKKKVVKKTKKKVAKKAVES